MAAGAGEDCFLQDCSANTELDDWSSKNDCNSSAACAECEIVEKDSNQMEGSEASFSTNEASAAGTSKETVAFKVIFNKQKHDVEFDLDKTIGDVKAGIEKIIGVPASMQKIMFKGLAKDDMTLEELKVTKGAKMMVVGSTLTDVLSISAPTTSDSKDDAKEAASSKEPLSQQKIHKKVLEKYGKPDDVMPGFQGKKYPLPSHPLSGMYNKSGGKVRLTFKLELDQLWIGTKERTDKIPMSSIKAVVNEALEGHEDYQIMGLQLGTTEASRYWVYWVPSQYAEAIKDAILGKWQYF